MTVSEQYRLKPEFLRAISVTILLISVYRLGILISIPFIDDNAINEYFKAYNYFSSTFAERVSIFSLGLMPFISAYILVEIFSLFIPPLKQLRKGDSSGRRKLKQIALSLALPLGILQASGIINGLKKMVPSDGIKILNINSNYEYILLVAILVGSMYLLIIISELISKFGIGHGISILILSGICVKIYDSINRNFTFFNKMESGIYLLIILIYFFIALSAVILLRTKISIPIKHSNSEKSFTIFQFNTCPSGKIALFYAASIMMFPLTVLTFFSIDISFINVFMPGSLLYSIFFCFFVFVLSYLFAWFFFHPKKRLLRLKERGWKFSDPDHVAEKHLTRKMIIYNLPWTIFLCAIGVVPQILLTSFNIPFYIGGSSLYIAVAIGLDVLDRYNVQRQTRSGRLVKIAEFHDVYDASMIKKHMESIGITCYFQGFYHRQLLYFFGPYIDISLMTEKGDAEFVQEILKEYYNGIGLLRSPTMKTT